MRVSIAFLLVFVLVCFDRECQAFSGDLCNKVCNVSSWLCWLCTSVHAKPDNSQEEQESVLMAQLRPSNSKAEMVDKDYASRHVRRHKIMGGVPVNEGESPWTVR